MMLQTLEKTSQDHLFEEVQGLFVAMYQYMSDCGLNIPLADNGAQIWCNSFRKMLGRLNQLVIAIEDGKVVGFGAGNIRLGPAYLQSQKVGFISHVYVLPEFRKSGIAQQLVEKLEGWFNEKEVNSIELDVLVENTSAIAFWGKMDYQHELIKMRKV